jgi:glycosyltransferase involved in cell wall biosynthesis
MKILYVYNKYRSIIGGEDNVINNLIIFTHKRQHHTKLLTKSSVGIDKSIIEKVKAFTNAVYSRSARKEIQGILKNYRPDIVHIHNLYPLFSPSILITCHQANVPVVMSIHNYSLTCPNWHHLFKGQICELCSGGHEYYCIIKNCRNNLFESIGYALRTVVARKQRFFHNHVNMIIAPTGFIKKKLINAGFEGERISILPNIVPLPNASEKFSDGEYIAYVGRMSPEKGVDVLLAAAHKTLLPVRLAGDITTLPQLITLAPHNAKFIGLLHGKNLDEFYRKARFLVFPSTCYECGPLVISEAMGYGLPVIGSKIGGIPERIANGVTGLLFEPGNSEDLANKMKFLWDNSQLCKQMGIAARLKAIEENNEDIYCERLMSIYQQAIEMNITPVI